MAEPATNMPAINEGLALLQSPEIQTQLAAICRKYGIARLEAFGSVMREDFDAESDIDLLYTSCAGSRLPWQEADLAKLELAALFGREVDFIDREKLAQHWNWVLRREMLSATLALYEGT